MSRRNFLQIGSLGLVGLGLSDLLQLRAAAAAGRDATPDTAVILVYLHGGPPHLDTYDMKPDAPVEYRGEFRPIKTCVPGLELCEHLPRHARIADKLVLLRSMHQEFNQHPEGGRRFLTGRIPRGPLNGTTINDAPMVGSIVSKMREEARAGVPNYVGLISGAGGGPEDYSFGAAYLGRAHLPFPVYNGDFSDPAFRVRNLELLQADRLEDRNRLLAAFDTMRRDIDKSGTMASMDEFNRQAMEMLTSKQARKAFDLSLEPLEVRERYGRNDWGQRTLMARRLVEAGVSFVTVLMVRPPGYNSPERKNLVGNWDSHAVNGHIFDDFRYRAPFYDQAIAALIEDIHLRGLDKKVMVIVSGEFGRTPKISTARGTRTGVVQPGRDHWPNAFSVLMAGGGVRAGQVIGATNSRGEEPKERPLTPNDLWATMYRFLGIDQEFAFLDETGRPMPILPSGEPIKELLG